MHSNSNSHEHVERAITLFGLPGKSMECILWVGLLINRNSKNEKELEWHSRKEWISKERQDGVYPANF